MPSRLTQAAANSLPLPPRACSLPARSHVSIGDSLLKMEEKAKKWWILAENKPKSAILRVFPILRRESGGHVARPQPQLFSWPSVFRGQEGKV